MASPTEINTSYFETRSVSISTELLEDEEKPKQDIEVMCHIRDILDGGFQEENKKDPSFQIVQKYVLEYISKNCPHHFILDWIDIDPDRGGTPVEYCELCMTNRE